MKLFTSPFVAIFCSYPRISTWFSFLLLMVCGCQNTESVQSDGSIIVLGYVSEDFDMYKNIYGASEKNFTLHYTPLHYIESNAPVSSVKGVVIDGRVRWVIKSDSPLRVTPPLAMPIIVNPGDSIQILYKNDNVSYSGDNYKFALQNELMFVNRELSPPTKENFMVKNVSQYLLWSNYLDTKLALMMPIIESYREKLSDFDYRYYKSDIASRVEADRIQTFAALQGCVQNGTVPGMTSSDLVAIWDSTLYKPWSFWVRSLPEFYGSLRHFYTFNRTEVQRKFRFDYSNDSLNSKEIRTYLYYKAAKEKYKGLLRERLMAYILDEQTILELGPKNSMAQYLLKDYYKQPDFPEYKEHVRWLEAQATKLKLSSK